MNGIHDKWVRIGGIVLLSLNLFIIEGGAYQKTSWQEFVYVLLYLVSVVIILEFGRIIILSFHKRYPEPADSSKRFSLACLAVFVSNVFFILSTFYLSHLIRGIHAHTSTPLVIATLISALVLALIQTGIYEGYNYFIRLRKLEQEKEELLRVNLNIQYDSLKQQVSPHFLFNSINTVSSLIDKDPDKAKKFLAEMSKVYRYLLRTNEEGLTTLDTELQFLKSYFHLLKTRFQEGLNLQIKVDSEYDHYLLPALTLQLLIENAVKHNVVDSAHPLNIDISATKSGWLCVKNNLQKKKNIIPSGKVGLSNIMAKYKLLNLPGQVEIYETNEEFRVLIPLIQNHKS